MGTKQLALIVAVLVLAIAAYLVLRPLGDGDSDPGQPPPMRSINRSKGSAMLLATSILFALIGLVLGGAGLWLVLLGGSFFYLLAGLVFLLTAFLLARRSEARALALCGVHPGRHRLGGVGSRVRLVATRPSRRRHRASGPLAAHAMDSPSAARGPNRGCKRPIALGAGGRGRGLCRRRSLFDEPGSLGDRG